MSRGPRPELIVAVGLTTIVAIQPVVGVPGATGTAAVASGGRQDTTGPGSAVADTVARLVGVGIGAGGATGSFASFPEDASSPTVAPRSAPELGQAVTPTSTPSPAPSATPGTTGPSPDPVLVLSGLIAVVLLALGVWFLLR